MEPNKPKYKIGDIVVYKDRCPDDDQYPILYQSKIIESFASYHPDDIKNIEWFYITEETKKSNAGWLYDIDIIFKLN